MSTLVLFLFKLVSVPIYYLPYRFRYYLGVFLAVLWFDVFRIRRKVALENLKMAFPDWDIRKRTQVARKSCVSLGLAFIDYFLLFHFKKENFDKYFILKVDKEVQNYLKQGCLCISLHLGSYDFAITGAAVSGYPLSVISKQFKIKWLNAVWFDIRKKFGTVFLREEKSAFDILRGLKNKRWVVFVIDQFMGPPTGVKVNFFGHQTGTDQGLAMIALRTKCPVLPIYNFRQDDGKIILVVDQPVLLEETGDREKDIQAFTQKCTDKLEALIRQHPEQWMWIHRRWKEFRENG